MGALSGIKVLDLTQYIAGPYCTKVLSDYGAEVIKIEKPPSGDPARGLAPFKGNQPGLESSGLFLYLNTGKKSITLNLKSVEGRKIFFRLVKDADIVVESYAPGTMETLGINYDSVKALNPNVLMTSISNFGSTGPYKKYKLTDIVMYAMGLTMYGTGMADREPQKLALTLIQHQAGMIAAATTMGAYLGREMHGVSQHLDIALMETQLGSIDRTATQAISYSYAGDFPHTRVTAENAVSIMPMGIYPCADGYVTFVAANPLWWPRFVKMIDMPELSEDPRFQDDDFGFVYNLDYKDEMDALVLGWTTQLTKQEVMEHAQAAGMAGTSINSMEDVYNDPQFSHRGFFVDIEHPVAGLVRYPGTPAQLSESPAEFRRAPLLGEHNHEIYCDVLGYNVEELPLLREQLVI